MEAPRRFKCVLCAKRTKQKERRPLDGSINKPLRKFLRKTYMVETKNGDVICNKCRHTYYKDRSEKVSSKCSSKPQCRQDPPPENNITSPTNISLPISSLGGSHSQCFLCKRRGPKLLRVPAAARNDILIEKLVILPPGEFCKPFC